MPVEYVATLLRNSDNDYESVALKAQAAKHCGDREPSILDLPIAARKAYVSYQMAASKLGGSPTDEAAFRSLRDLRGEWQTSITHELGDNYPDESLSFESWSRNLRNARHRLGEQKYQRRSRGKS